MKKINFQGEVSERSGTINKKGVYIAKNLKRESVTLDRSGNEIDPRSKRILKYNNEKE